MGGLSVSTCLTQSTGKLMSSARRPSTTDRSTKPPGVTHVTNFTIASISRTDAAALVLQQLRSDRYLRKGGSSDTNLG
jgi:hypothetical protein